MRNVQEGYDIGVILTSEGERAVPLSVGDQMALKGERSGFVTFDLLPVETPELPDTHPIHGLYQELKSTFGESDGRRTIDLARQILHAYPKHINAHIYEAMGMGISGEHGLEMALAKNRETLALITRLLSGDTSNLPPYRSPWEARHYLHAMGIVLLNSADYEKQLADMAEDAAARCWHIGNARSLLDLSSMVVGSPEMLLRRLLRKAWCEREAGDTHQARETIAAARLAAAQTGRAEDILQKEELEYEGVVAMMRPEPMRGIA